MEQHSSPLDPDVLAKLKGLKVRAHRVVDGVLAGMHRSSCRGESVDFAEHKEYTPGDDPRHLDWRVLARLDRMYIKKYEAECNLQAVLAIDCSGSMGYASGTFSKVAYASLLAASLAMVLLRQGDAVGLILVGGQEATWIPPLAGPEHLSTLVEALEGISPSGPTSIQRAAERYVEGCRRRGMLVLFSDLFDPNPNMLGSLRMVAARGHEVVVFQVLDPDEVTFPFEDPTLFVSMEDERSILSFPREIRKAYLDEMNQFLGGIRRALSEGDIAYDLVRTDEPPHQPLIRELYGQRRRFKG